MAYSDTQWEKAKAYYEAGLTLAKIKEKTGIARNTVSQRAKREQWEHGADTDYIASKEIIAGKKGTKTEQHIAILDEIADDNIKLKAFFSNSAITNQIMTNKAIESIDTKKDGATEDDLDSLERHSRITQRNKETVLGKDKTTEISQTQQTEVKSISVTYE